MAEPQDLIDLLVEDHERMRDLLERLDCEEDPERVRPLFLELAEALVAHEAMEHEVLFPALGAGVHEVHEREGEHEEINQLLEEMRTLSTTGFGFLKRTCAVVLELREHFETEETVLFPMARLALTPEERVELGRRAAVVRDGALAPG